MSDEVTTGRRGLVGDEDGVEALPEALRRNGSSPELLEGAFPATPEDVRYPPAPEVAETARPRMWPAIVAGLLTTLTLLALGSTFASSRPMHWTAEVQFLVGPPRNVDRTRVPAYYETLSRGQVVATAAEIMGERRFRDAAVNDLGLPAGSDASVLAKVVPGTALVSVTATGQNRDEVERLPDAVVDQAAPTINGLLSPYMVHPLGSSAGSGRQSGLTLGQFIAVLALVAVVAGIAVQQIVQHLSAARRQRISRRP